MENPTSISMVIVVYACCLCDRYIHTARIPGVRFTNNETIHPYRSPICLQPALIASVCSCPALIASVYIYPHSASHHVTQKIVRISFCFFESHWFRACFECTNQLNSWKYPGLNISAELFQGIRFIRWLLNPNRQSLQFEDV